MRRNDLTRSSASLALEDNTRLYLAVTVMALLALIDEYDIGISLSESCLEMAKLYFRYAAMNAGKSTALLQAAFNYEERGMRIVLLTAELDNRDGHGKIASRLGLARDALTFNAAQSMAERIATAQQQAWISQLACVLIDESQFLTQAQVQELHRWAHEHNIPVMCYGLRSDFQGNAFEGAATLLVLADDVEEMKTICDCGKKASMNARFDDEGNRLREGDQVLIGGNTRYRALCPNCFYS